ncbi:MAG: hypothetical protein ACRCX8_14195, partial [Sarcina sp.]
MIYEGIKNVIRNRHMLDIRRLIEVAREREEDLRKNTTISYRVEKNNISLEDLYKSDLISKIGLVIDTSRRYDKQGIDPTLIELDSILSYKFGVKESDPASVKELKYTCNCEKDNVKKAGEWCDKCKSYAVEHKKVRGWILLNDFKVFNPDMLTMFVSNKRAGAVLKKSSNFKDASGRDKFPWLSNQEFRYNIYNLQKPEILREFIVEFSKPENVDYFLDRIDMFMTSKIPVMSKNLRHHQVVTKLDGTPDIRSHDINKFLTLINNKVDDLNNNSSEWSSGKVTRYLADINKGFVNIHDEVMKILGDGKNSDIRGRVGGVRKGSSSKLIIEGSMDHVTHVCTLPYSAFSIMTIQWHYDLYVKYGLNAESEFRIRNMMPNRDDYPMIYKVLRELQEQDLAWVSAYRPPTLFRCSWQGMFIMALTE